MPRSQVWKDFEREIAKWMGTARNIGSGKINSTDEGVPRPGDIVFPTEYGVLVECKTRIKFPVTGSYTRAEETMAEAKVESKPNWFHFERKNGSKKIYMLATSPEWMEKICNFLKEELERNSSDSNTI